MSLANIPFFRMTERAGARITFQSDEGHLAHLFILEEGILRMMVLTGGVFSFPRTWAIAPRQEDVPLEGRDRFDLGGFALPPYQLEQNSNTVQITTNRVRLTIQLQGLYCR
jgi:alpha-glucosidase